MPNVNSIWLKTKELLTYHYGCHSNLVTQDKKSYLRNTVVAEVCE